MKYEVILLDIDETLFDFKKAERFALEKTMNHCNIDYNDKNLSIYRRINDNIWQELEKGLISADNLKLERPRRFFNELGLSANPKEFRDTYLNLLGEGAFLFDESIELLSYLSNKYRLCVITNGLSDVQNRRLDKAAIREHFEHIVISEDIGFAKPDSKIFEHTLEILGHKNKNSVLMIGDSLKSDIQGGINAGIDTCWYNPSKNINNTNIIPTYEVHNLLDIKNII
jgi:putative hydrolase of the HAD superfamily